MSPRISNFSRTSKEFEIFQQFIFYLKELNDNSMDFHHLAWNIIYLNETILQAFLPSIEVHAFRLLLPVEFSYHRLLRSQI